MKARKIIEGALPTHTTRHSGHEGSTWFRQWHIHSYPTPHGERWAAENSGVRLTGYDSREALVRALETRNDPTLKSASAGAS